MNELYFTTKVDIDNLLVHLEFTTFWYMFLLQDFPDILAYIHRLMIFLKT